MTNIKEAFVAFHKDIEKVTKYTRMHQIGRIDPKESRLNKLNFLKESSNESSYILKQAEMKKDFEDLRKLADKMDLFKPSYFFFVFNALQIIFFHLLGYWILWNYGYGPLSFIFASISLIVAQVN